ncbi:hypothetical protein E1281_11675 [Actinomadura sp. KC345]|uniref:hypothetical protein n=1 Tax=Actinomadura sp. KC345 TaxID=2530371 RepID=UPI0010470CE2|nr:hypothetical protein [Actinomadura sp. KC345]TDC55586.1 hypothetical protein E1281_11675 [Actinomadura sp. KC345]
MTGAHSTVGGAGLSQHFRVQAPPGRSAWERLGPVVRGLLAVLALLATAVDALVTALLGTAPLAPRLHRAGRIVADEYRAGHAGAVDAEVVDDHEEQEVWR